MMQKNIPYGRQSINQTDIDAVIAVLRSDWLTQGPCVPAFESAIANYCGAAHAVAVNSATSALHIACLALGVTAGDWVWTVPNTFVASANCALYCGAKIDFVDIDFSTGNISLAALEAKLVDAEKSGSLPKVLVVVDFSGRSCDMAEISQLVKRYDIALIEDASHAIGGFYHEKPIGNCQFSDITVFSFHPVKIITTAEGGMAITNSSMLAEKLRLLRSHGVTRDPDLLEHVPDGEWYYEQQLLGFNYRMTDVQAALGLSQLNRLTDFVQARRVLADAYTEQFKTNVPQVITPCMDSETIFSAWHLYVIRVAASVRKRFFNYLRQHGILVNVHYIPVHLQPFYQRLGFKLGDYPGAEQHYATAVTLPLYPELERMAVEKIIQLIQKFDWDQ